MKPTPIRQAEILERARKIEEKMRAILHRGEVDTRQRLFDPNAILVAWRHLPEGERLENLAREWLSLQRELWS